MKEKKKAWFLPYRLAAPADLEAYFETQEASGWHVDNIKQLNSFLLTLTKQQPRQYKYVVELKAKPDKSYTSTYQEYGWELVGKMASLYIWRQEYTDVRPEAFTDTGSIAERSNNIARVLMAMVCFLVVTILALGIIFVSTGGIKNPTAVKGTTIATVLIVTLIILLLAVRSKIKKNRHR